MAVAASLACTGARRVAVPLDGAWHVESYRAGESAQSGARGFQAVAPSAGLGRVLVPALEISAALHVGDKDRRQGEIVRYLEDVIGLPVSRDGRAFDLMGARITFVVRVPEPLVDSHAPAGAQVFVESENADGIVARQYGAWTNLDQPGAIDVVLVPASKPASPPIELSGDHAEPGFDPGDYTDPGFDPERIVRCGVKIGLNSSGRLGFTGTIRIRAVRIHLPSAEERGRLAEWRRSARTALIDSEFLERLPAPPRSGGGRAIPPGGTLSAGSPSVRHVSVAPAPQASQDRRWEVSVRFDAYRPEAEHRSARVAHELKSMLDLRQKKITAWAAVGPGLRGVMARPSQIQIELYDGNGRVMRGPAANLSQSGFGFSASGLAASSRWVRMEAAPISGVPLAMGYREPGFEADKIRRVGVRFEVGKFSHVLRHDPYPLAGRLVLSEFRVEDHPHPDVSATRAGRPRLHKPPVPIDSFIVGLNYPFFHYGWDVGTCPYGGRDAGGFSGLGGLLDRDFARFKASGIDVVRVFILADLRTGLVRDPQGAVKDLDRHVLPDLEALTGAAARHGISLMPVLLDFRVADGVAEQDLGFALWRWHEGEAPELLVDARLRATFIDNAIRPIARRLAEADRRHPKLIYAIDVVNEIENAVAVMTPGHFQEVRTFVNEVRDAIRAEAPGLAVTLGSRDRDDLMNGWSDVTLDVWQFHHYDKMTEEENRPLDFPAGALGLAGSIVIGEVEPSDIERKLDVIHRNGYDGAFFWSYRAADGYVTDLDAIRRWVERNKRNKKPGGGS